MDELATKLVDSLEKVETALQTMAPEAFGRLIEAAYISGSVDLIWGGVEVLMTLTGVAILFWWIKRIPQFTSEQEMEAIATGVTCTIAGLIAFVSFIAALISLSHTDSWLAVIDPAAYVVKTLLYN